MTAAIYIPASIEDAITALAGIGQLLTAKQWERAAIVYAFTEPGTGGPRTGGNTPQLSIREFADLGITGLRDKGQVREYRKAWESAAAEVGNEDMLRIEPGDAVDMPDLPWKEHFGEPTIEVQERVARTAIVKNPELVREAIAAHPVVARVATEQVVATAKAEPTGEVGEAVTEAVAKDSGLSLRVDQHRYFGGSRSYQTDEHADRDRERMVARSYDERFRRVMREMTELALALREGRWKPLDTWTVEHAQRFFPELFREDPTPVLDQIEAFLATKREVAK